MADGPLRGRRALVWLALIAFASAPIGWFGSDALERDDDFCNACHLPSGLALHTEVRRDFDARPPPTLAGAHAVQDVSASPIDHLLGQPGDRAMRCIDCHGGTGLVGRAKVKVLAAKDAFFYVVGRFDEPTGMTHPLDDADCRRCHATFPSGEDELSATPAFHDLGVHNTELGVACVECHFTHDREVDPDVQFLAPARVRSQCSRCHTAFEEGSS